MSLFMLVFIMMISYIKARPEGPATGQWSSEPNGACTVSAACTEDIIMRLTCTHTYLDMHGWIYMCNPQITWPSTQLFLMDECQLEEKKHAVNIQTFVSLELYISEASNASGLQTCLPYHYSAFHLLWECFPRDHFCRYHSVICHTAQKLQRKSKVRERESPDDLD